MHELYSVAGAHCRGKAEGLGSIPKCNDQKVVQKRDS